MCCLYHDSQECCTMSVGIPLPLVNYTSGTSQYTPQSHGTGDVYHDTHTLSPSWIMLATVTSISEAATAGWLVCWLNTQSWPFCQAGGKPIAIEGECLHVAMVCSYNRVGKSLPKNPKHVANLVSACCSVEVSLLSLLSRMSGQMTDKFKGVPDVS